MRQKREIDIYHFFLHETKKHIGFRYILSFIIFLIYLGFVIHQYGVNKGFLISFITWSFFVLCTPIADAGLLLDLPIRIISGVRMVYSEIIVWSIAVLLNLYAYFFNSEIYSSTLLLNLFYQILSHPFPLWMIIVLSSIGTFMSIYFGDELLDVVFHHERKKYHQHNLKLKFISYLTTILLVIVMYNYLLSYYGIKIL